MLIIHNGLVIDPKSHLEDIRDLFIDEGKIVRIAVPQNTAADHQTARPSAERNSLSPESPARKEITAIDATGCIVCPGLIDTHSHFRDPGFTWKEDLHTGSLAAAKGGYTSVILMANTNPTVDSPETLKDILARGSREKIHLYSGANVTKGMQGTELTDMKALADAGARVFTDDGKPVLSEELFREALKTAAELGIPVSLHEENPQYIKENGINGGGTAACRLGIEGSFREAEISMVRRDTAIAEKLPVHLLIQHISTKEGVDLVRKAKKVNPFIWAEATPHHFSLTEDAILRKGSLAKVNPPLRTEEDRLAIIEGLRDGTIDIIATDHAPHSDEEKAAVPLWKAPSGMIGLETALSLSIRELVNPGFLTMSQMLAKLTCNPAIYYRLPAGELREGGPADITIFDPDASWTVPQAGASKSHNSPFIGETLPGVVRWTIANGRSVYPCRDLRL